MGRIDTTLKVHAVQNHTYEEQLVAGRQPQIFHQHYSIISRALTALPRPLEIDYTLRTCIISVRGNIIIDQ
jgi:hypothetical protein